MTVYGVFKRFDKTEKEKSSWNDTIHMIPNDADSPDKNLGILLLHRHNQIRCEFRRNYRVTTADIHSNLKEHSPE